MVDINFPSTDAVKTIAPSIQNALVYTTGNTVDGKVQLKDNLTLRLSDDGVFSTSTDEPIIAYNIDEVSIFELAQTVTTTGATTVIDLKLGTNIILKQAHATTISFTKPGSIASGTVFFCIKREHDATNNSLSLDFTSSNETIRYEGGAIHSYTQTANAKDIILGSIGLDTSIVLRKPKNNIVRSTGTLGHIRYSDFYSYIPKKTKPSTNVTGVETGMIITGMADKTMNAVPLKTSGERFLLGTMQLVGCLLESLLITTKGIAAQPTLAIDMSKNSLIKLSHGADITQINLTVPDPNKKYSTIIWRVKDNSAIEQTIYFDPAIFIIDPEATLTQTANAIDWIQITSHWGKNYVTIANNFPAYVPVRKGKASKQKTMVVKGMEGKKHG